MLTQIYTLVILLKTNGGRKYLIIQEQIVWVHYSTQWVEAGDGLWDINISSYSAASAGEWIFGALWSLALTNLGILFQPFEAVSWGRRSFINITKAYKYCIRVLIRGPFQYETNIVKPNECLKSCTASEDDTI